MDVPNIFALGQDAFDNAYGMGEKQRTTRARIQAGRALAGGDYQGAEAQLGNAGLNDEAVQALSLGQQQQARNARIDAATAYGNGDAKGAIAALGQTGDIAGQSAIQQETLQKQQAQQTFVQQQATKLQAAYAQAKQQLANDPQGQQKATAALLQAFDSQTPIYQQNGIDPTHLAGIRQALAQNPDAVLTVLASPPKHSFQKIGENSLGVFNENTGQLENQYSGSKFEKLGPGDTLVDVGGTGGGPAASGQPAQGQSPGAQGGFDAIYGGFVAPHEGGYTAHDGNGAPANFGINQKANPDINVANLKPDQAKQILKDRYWTPSGADQLPPALQAIQFDTAVNMGVGAAKQLLQASGGDPAKYLQLRAARYQQIAQNDPSKASSLPNWLQRNNDLAQYVSQMGQAAPSAQASGQPAGARVVAQGSMAGAFNSQNSNLSGDAFLQSLPPAMATTVKAIAEGRVAPPTGAALRSPQTQMILQAVTQYDPSFDAANAPARFKTRQDFTSGASAKNLTAFNTALAHLSQLDTAITNLGNTGFPLNNYLAHGIADLTGTDARVQQFEAVKRTALDEVNKALVGSGGSLADREALMARMNHASSPTTLRAVVKDVADLLQGKITALGQQYKQGMGTDEVPIQLITPQAQATLDRLEGRGAAAPATAAAPSAGWGQVVRH